MINFIKTPAYETRPKGKKIFNYLNLLGLQLIDPPPKKSAGLIIKADLVLYSPARRVREGVNLKTKNKFEILALKEITFNLKKMVTEEELSKYGSSIVRARFKKAFIKDKLPVKRTILLKEAKEIINRCLAEPSKTEIAIISHSFRLKIIEAFIKTNGQLAQNPELIHNFLKDEEKTYEFGQGFSVSNKTLKLKFNS